MATNPRIDDLRKRLEKEPGSRLFAQLAEELRKAGEPAEAVAVARAGLQAQPNYPTARMTLGRALMESGDLAGARSEFEIVLKGAADNILASRLLAECLEGLGQNAAALGRYRLTLQLAPGDKAVEARIAALATGAAVTGGAPTPPTIPARPVQMPKPAAPPQLGRPATTTGSPAAGAAGKGTVPAATVAPRSTVPAAPIAPPPRPPAAVEPPPIPLVEAPEEFELEKPYETPAVAPAAARPVASGPPTAAPAAALPGLGRMDEFEFEDQGPTTLFGMKVPEWVKKGTPEPTMAPPAPAPPPPAPSTLHAVSPIEEEFDFEVGPATLPSMAPPVPPAAAGPPARPAAASAPAPSAEGDFEFELEQPAKTMPFRPIIPDIPLAPAIPAAGRPAPAQSAEPELATPTLAELYFNQGATDKALAIYRQLVAREPANIRLRARLAEIEALDRHLRGESAPKVPHHVRVERRKRAEAAIGRLTRLLTLVQQEYRA